MRKPRPLRILLTSMGCTGAQNLIWQLRRSERAFVVGVDARAEHGGMDLPDLCRQVPMGMDRGFVPALTALVEEHGIELLVAIMEPELSAVSRSLGVLEAAGTKVLISPATTIATCASKTLLARTFEDLGIDTPALLDPAGSTPFPWFARPDHGSGSRGAMIVRDRLDLEHISRREAPQVFTEYVEGEEYSIDGFCERDGRLVHAICRTRGEMHHGLAVRSTVVPLADRLAVVERLCAQLELFGFFNLQLRHTACGREVYYDLNPRLGGAMVLSFAAGLDAGRYLRATVRGEPIPGPHRTQLGLRLRRRWHNLFVDDQGVHGGAS